MIVFSLEKTSSNSIESSSSYEKAHIFSFTTLLNAAGCCCLEHTNSLSQQRQGS